MHRGPRSPPHACTLPLPLACVCAQKAPADAVRLLLVRGARVQAKGRRGMTAVDCAEGRTDILLVLAQHCAARALNQMAQQATAAAQRAARITAKAAAGLVAAAGAPLLALPDAGAGGAGSSSSGAAGASSSGSGGGAAASSSAASSSSATAGGLANPPTEWGAASSQLYAAAMAAAGGGQGANAAGLQHLLGSMGVPSSLTDLGNSPLDTPGPAPPPAGGPQVSPQTSSGARGGAGGSQVSAQAALLDLLSQGGTAQIGLGNSADPFGEAMQLLSCINGYSQAVAAATGGTARGAASRSRTAPTRKRRTPAAAGAAGSSSGGGAAAAAAGEAGGEAGGPLAGGPRIEEISSVTHLPVRGGAVTGKAAAGGPRRCACFAGGGGGDGSEGGSGAALASCVDVSGGCSVSGEDGVLKPQEHQLRISCSAGHTLAFHLPCWKVSARASGRRHERC